MFAIYQHAGSSFNQQIFAVGRHAFTAPETATGTLLRLCISRLLLASANCLPWRHGRGRASAIPMSTHAHISKVVLAR